MKSFFRRGELFLIVLSFAATSKAASVLWDCFSLGKLDGETYHLVWKMPAEMHHDHGVPQYVDSMFKVEYDGSTKVTNWGGYPEDAALMIQVAIGDKINGALFDGADKAFANNLVPFGSVLPETPINVTGPDNVYLGFVSYDVYLDSSSPVDYRLGNAFYGWVGLHVDGDDVSLIGSYVDLGGNAVIAGRYESAIPEPAGGLLLLLGAGLLALRRRRRMSARAFHAQTCW